MPEQWKDTAGGLWRRGRPAAVLLGRWLVAAVVIGGLCGGIGTAFHLAVDEATRLRGQTPWLLYLLPLAGLAIVQIYKATGTEGLGTNDVIDAVQDGKPVALLLLPAIFLSTVLTHLTGGSAGRERRCRWAGTSAGRPAGCCTCPTTAAAPPLSAAWRPFSPPCSAPRWRPLCSP